MKPGFALAWIWFTTLCALAQQSPGAESAGPPATDEALCARARLSSGGSRRLGPLFDKARRGQPLTIGVIGGSITAGAAASRPELRYGNRVAAWWRQSYPGSEINLVNAGIGATGSDYGALRVGRDLLALHPDLVIVEFAVNDPNQKSAAETLEGLVRQLLQAPNHPAVLLLFLMHNNGSNAQQWHSQVGRHYALPMVSFRDALWPEIQAGRLQWKDVEADAVHPNDRGHGYAAQFVDACLAAAAKAPPDSTAPPAAEPLPPPLFTDLYEHTALLEAGELRPLTNHGWALDRTNHCWKSDQPGSVIVFEVDGRAVLTMHRVIRGPMGRARVTVDGAAAQELEGWFDQTWGGYRQTREIARDLSPGKHRVRLELLPDKSAGSTGHEFWLYGLGAAGLSDKPSAGPAARAPSRAP